MSTHSDQSAGERKSRTIREVLELLAGEFPDVTVSKIRFLESRGLIRPERTASGYRKFDDNDVERLRWILRQQRENFLPLKVIKGRLEQGADLPIAPSLFDDEYSSDDAEEFESSASRHPSNGFEPDPHHDEVDDETAVEQLSEQGSDATEEEEQEQASVVSRRRRTSGESSDPANEEEAHSSGSRRSRAGKKHSGVRTMTDGSPGWSADELAAACSVDVRTVSELDDYGLLDAEGSGESRCFGLARWRSFASRRRSATSASRRAICGPSSTPRSATLASSRR